MRYRILGPLSVAAPEGGAVELGPKLRRLLAALLLHSGEVVTLDQLAICLWGEEQPRDARSALQVHVVRLRRHLGADLRTTGPGYALTVRTGDLDAEVFTRSVGRARTLATDGLLDDAVRTLEAALGLWRGEPVEGLEGPGFDEPVRRLQRLRTQAEDDHVDVALTLGRSEDFLGTLEDRVAADPTRVLAWGQLARAFAATGRSASVRELEANVRALGLDVPGSSPGPTSVGRRSPPATAPQATELAELQTDLRAFLTLARPHALPTSVLQRAVDLPGDMVLAALRQDPATSQAGRPPIWRLRDDVDGDIAADTADRLASAAVAEAAVAGAGLLGPDIRAAAAICRLLAPLLEAGLRAGTSSVGTVAAMGRWWSIEGREDLGRLAAAAVLETAGDDSLAWLDAHGWALDLAGRLGDGRLVELLVDALPPEPREPEAAATWVTTQGHAAEVVQDVERAQTWFVDAADRWRSLHVGAGEVACCCNAANAARLRGDHELARQLIERARALPVSAVAPLPRHWVTATDAALRFELGDFGAARDMALSAEVLVRGVADRVADRTAVLAAEAAFFRGDYAEVRLTLARADATPDARTRLVAGTVKAEAELAEGHPDRAVRTLEALWARDGDLLRLGLGSVLGGVYARIALSAGRPDLAAELLGAAAATPGPWGRLDDEIRSGIGMVAEPAGDVADVISVVRRAREELVAAVGDRPQVEEYPR